MRRLARSGKLPGVKFASEWRFAPGDVRALVPVGRPAVVARPDLASVVEARMNAVFARGQIKRPS